MHALKKIIPCWVVFDWFVLVGLCWFVFGESLNWRPNQNSSIGFGVRSHSRNILIGIWMVKEFVFNYNLRIKRPL